ncbi:MAG: protoheme IX farnesyltransferase [Sphingomonadales bacterium]|nr:protoheme IX farnesyltransferase [Sphingomonadales bacterium]
MNTIVKAYFDLVKFRLTSTVVATSIFGYLLGCKFHSADNSLSGFNWLVFSGVLLGGLLIVFGSNGLNQLLEKTQDSQMSRTQTRPIVEGRLSESQARVFSLLCGIAGVVVLLFTAPLLTAILGGISLLLYVFVYTPLKGVTPLAVMIGAIPGALPPLIGYTAATGAIDEAGVILFLVQFFWQFPHFWAIAWLLHDDYQKAGYWLLPSKGGRDKYSAFQILVYTLILIATSAMPVVYGMCDTWVLAGVLPAGILFLFYAVKLHKTLEISDARKLLFTSFLHTPVVFLSYILF